MTKNHSRGHMALSLKNVTKSVGAETFIYETNLTLKAGDFNILLGATNAGKTTLIKLMAGLEKPTSGSVWLDDEDITELSPQKRNISLVHQFFVNYPHLTVFDNIASPLRVAGMAKSEIEGRVEEAADILQLRPMLYRYPQELSGGQQQRTALARAIAKESQIVFLDEPLANLDYKLREELRDQLPELFSGRGAVVVYATSEPIEALMLRGHTALIHEGRITQFGPTINTYRYPATLTSAQVFSDPPINTAKVVKQGTELILKHNVCFPAGGQAAGLADGSYTVAIRPHYVVPVKNSSAEMPISGTVHITELSGSESIAHFDIGDGQSWVSLSHGVHPYRVGDEHKFYIDTSHCFFFSEDGELAAKGAK